MLKTGQRPGPKRLDYVAADWQICPGGVLLTVVVRTSYQSGDKFHLVLCGTVARLQSVKIEIQSSRRPGVCSKPSETWEIRNKNWSKSTLELTDNSHGKRSHLVQLHLHHLACQGHSKPQLIRFMTHKLSAVRKNVYKCQHTFVFVFSVFVYFMKTAYKLFKLLFTLLSAIKFKK